MIRKGLHLTTVAVLEDRSSLSLSLFTHCFHGTTRFIAVLLLLYRSRAPSVTLSHRLINLHYPGRRGKRFFARENRSSFSTYASYFRTRTLFSHAVEYFQPPEKKRKIHFLYFAAVNSCFARLYNSFLTIFKIEISKYTFVRRCHLKNFLSLEK